MQIQYLLVSLILDSEWSDECIDFTMFSFSSSKMNLVGALRRSFFEFPNSFQKFLKAPGKTKKKLRKNGNFYAKPCHLHTNTLAHFFLLYEVQILQILTKIRQNHDS
ncbi:Uncharacterized protein FWK35_00010501 [Aphis craccivora]|uniref:Uncharacterized protein n=1 Tax=Aphis craccivora TaxID=307492 RepID=A0A6G0YMZ9_APHCR|nr:Uncharacterized protein FWK35_00010501 [Aphis craccivora]